ncbi:MAG: GTP cyclohydrolase I FolE [Alphaproteobacteria bacterium]|nr:GTP cyclohydrolase I FolE [Alphaproteobacteria bacterium]
MVAVKTAPLPDITRPSRDEAEEAVRTLIKWAGDNPYREGLVKTPKRVTNAYEELFAGYNNDPKEVLSCTFEESGGYNEIVALTDIRLESYCEHHIMPIIGNVHIAYIPNKKVVGISKLARLVEVFSKRLQIQEALTAQIADSIFEALEPQGVAVVVDAQHHCMTTRGIQKPGVGMVTKRMLGTFQDNIELRNEFYGMIGMK